MVKNSKEAGVAGAQSKVESTGDEVKERLESDYMRPS